MKKITMVATLKSGAKVEKIFKFKKKERASVIRTIAAIEENLQNDIGREDPSHTSIIFGRTIIAISEIAAISFEEG
jgi:hypothetical protein